MRLVSLQMKNIKSHRATDLDFSPGINVLSGPNGAGKSTIFEAIGYALFGVSAQDFVSKADRFLSIGAKRGEISVVFQPADGELYRVTRTVGPSAKWLLAKKSGDDFEVEEHANLQETETRIAALLGLNNGRSLADQFKLVIGPFQNDFLGPFVIKQPTKRQDAFDEILGIDAWRKTFDGTKALAGTIQSKMETLKAEVAGREDQVAALPGRRSELQALREAEALKHGELAGQQETLQGVSALLANCDAEKERCELLKSELLALEERIASGKDHLANQQLQVDQARSADRLVQGARPGKERFDQAEASLKQLRADEQTKVLLEKKTAELEKELSGLKAGQQIEERELRELAEAIGRDVQRLEQEAQGLTQARAMLKEQDDAARHKVDAVQNSLTLFRGLLLHRVESALPYLLVALDRLSSIDDELGARGGVLESEGAVRRAAGELSGLRHRLDEVQGKKSQLLGRKLSLAEGSEKLAAGQCPFFQEPCRNLENSGGGESFGSRISDLDLEMAQLDTAAAELTLALAGAQSAEKELLGIEKVAADLQKLAQEREKVEREFTGYFEGICPQALWADLGVFLESVPYLELPKTRFALSLEGAPKERRGQLEEWSDRVRDGVVFLEETLGAELKRVEEPLQAAQKKQVELGAKGEELARLQAELATRKEKLLAREKAILVSQQRRAALQQDLVKLAGELARYQGVGERITQAQAELERFRGDRDAFIANEKSAQELEKRLEILEKYQARLQELEVARAAKVKDLELLNQSYSPQRHEAARQDRERLVSTIATLSAELAAIAENAQRLEGEVAALTALAEEVQKKLEGIDRLAEKGVLVKFLRNQVFKNVSSQLSERFREEISFRADRIYRNIAESDEELVWGENYQVVLRDLEDGVVRERSDDQLSGGQMMSAVVALRLALLQTIGARIAFFDEPTSNLDAGRRENLARAFRAIDVGQEEVTEHWYDQLFLVSHDVSFTEITDQMIHLGGE